jgi:homocysteine S-methyltransferase
MPSSTKRFRDWLSGTPIARSLIPRILVLDGGVSTHLESIAGSHFRYRQLWSSSLLLHGHDIIRQGHLDWLQSGANVISTVSYQCHYEQAYWPKQKDGTDVLTENIVNVMWKDALQLAHNAIIEYEQNLNDPSMAPTQKGFHFLLASSGCYGAILANGAEYTGNYGSTGTDENLEQFHARKLRSILSQPVLPDGIVIETVPSLAECRAIRNIMLDCSSTSNDIASSGVAVVVSLACRDEAHLNDGTLLADALAVLNDIASSRLQAVGLNCCDSSNLPGALGILVPYLAKHYKETGEARGICLYPNSGEIWNAASQSWEEGTGCTESKNMAKRLLNCIRNVELLWRRHEPTAQFPSILVGGCCRTSPATIKCLREAVDEHLCNGENAPL